MEVCLNFAVFIYASVVNDLQKLAGLMKMLFSVSVSGAAYQRPPRCPLLVNP